MQMREFIQDYLYFLKKGVDRLDWARLENAADHIWNCSGTVWLIGNGGSACLASHMATDLQLASVRAIALTDVAALTTYANDLAFSYSFSAQLNRLMGREDILIALSGSGNSGNILDACAFARKKGVYVIGLSGFQRGGSLNDPGYCDLHLHAPADSMGQVQDLQQVMLHIICYWLMKERKAI